MGAGWREVEVGEEDEEALLLARGHSYQDQISSMRETRSDQKPGSDQIITRIRSDHNQDQIKSDQDQTNLILVGPGSDQSHASISIRWSDLGTAVTLLSGELNT